MTPEEIKKIADVCKIKAITDCKQDTIGIKRIISDGCIDTINRISERYYLVEKSKVEKKYKRYVEYGKTANNDCGKCFREIVCKQIFEPLFGSEIGKEDGE